MFFFKYEKLLLYIVFLKGIYVRKIKFVKNRSTKSTQREVGKRKGDFNEIYKDFINEKAKEQSSRCSQCGVPFCQVHCPLSNNIPDWLKLTAEGRLKCQLAQSTNNMPEVCGRICPQDSHVREIVLLSNQDMVQLRLAQ